MPSNDPYNLVVIGAGTSGLAAAIGAAELGARVALIERDPTRAPRLSVRALACTAHEIARSQRTARGYFASPLPALDYNKVHASLSAQCEAKGAPGLELARAKGVECIAGHARFLDQTTVEVNGKPLKFARALIATGSSIRKPDSVSTSSSITSDELLKIRELPPKLIVLGSNADALAVAQSFARLGSVVTLSEASDRLLSAYASRSVKLVTEALVRDGVQIRLECKNDMSQDLSQYDCVILCSPRVPEVQTLNLDAAKVALELDGRLCVNEKFQTTNPHIYACGGVISREPSPHESEAQSRCVIGNALFLASHMQSELVSPRIVYTDPEIAAVGLTPENPATESLEETVIEYPEGFLCIVHTRKGDILGATIVARHASEFVGEVALAMNHQVNLGSLGSDIHPHGSFSDFIKRCGDIHHRKLLTPKLAKSLSRFLKWRR